MKTNSKEALFIEKAKQGDHDAFAHLIERYKGILFNLSYRMTGSYDLASDLVQETFLRAYAKLNSFDSNKNFFTWIYTICLNITKDHLKKNKNNTFFQIDHCKELTHSGLSSDIDEFYQKDNQILITKSLQVLPIELRKIIIMRFFQDMSFSEIAAICSITENTAKKRVYKALKILQEHLSHDVYGLEK